MWLTNISTNSWSLVSVVATVEELVAVVTMNDGLVVVSPVVVNVDVAVAVGPLLIASIMVHW